MEKVLSARQNKKQMINKSKHLDQDFLDKISQKLTVSIDHKLTMQEIANLIVPQLADYTRIALKRETGELDIFVNHKDGEKLAVATRLYDEYKDNPAATFGVPAILSSGKPEIISRVEKKLLKRTNTSTNIKKTVSQLDLKSYMGVPLIAHSKVIGAITFSSTRSDLIYTEQDLALAQEIARRVALTIENARLYESALKEITERKKIENNLLYLAEAGKILASSLDFKITLDSVAKLAVPRIADWCSIEMLNADGELELVAIAHKDPNKIKWAKELRKTSTLHDMSASSGVPHVLKTGKPELHAVISEEMLSVASRSDKELRLIKSLGLTSVMLIPIFSEGKPIGAINFVSAESKKQFNQADLRMAEEIGKRASLAIEHAKLYENAQSEIKERKKLEKQKDQFVGVASHELKTPVTSLKAYAQVLKRRFEKNGDSSAAEQLGKMDAQLDKLTNLISDLLDITKIESGKLAFQEEQFDFNELVANIVEEMQRTTEKHTIVIKGSISRSLVGDRERVGQVLVNLLSNAIKYSPASSQDNKNYVKIIVKYSERKDNVLLCVQDFGMGIPKEKQQRVFERFFRVSGPRLETYPGLGLGLYISSEIINRLGGKIWVESVEKKGSSFFFTLPIIK